MPQSCVASEFLISPIGELHTGIGDPIHGAALLVKDTKVAEIGMASEYGKGDFDASNHVITPGLVDCHTHLVWGGERSGEFIRRCMGETYQKIAEEGGGILSTMRATRNCTVEELTDGIVERCHLLNQLGTTTVEIKASYGLSPESVDKELTAIENAKSLTKTKIASTFMGAHAFPPEKRRKNIWNV